MPRADPGVGLNSPGLRIAALAVGLWLGLGWCLTLGAEEGPLLLGMSAAFQGPSRGLGIETYRGAMAYFGKINAEGGVAGRQIRIVALDDSYQPTPAIHNTIELVQKRHVLLLFGYVGTPTVTRILPLLKGFSESPAYLMFPFTGAQPQREAPYDRLCYNLRASYREETQGLVDGFVSVGRKRTGIFYQADAYGRSGWDGVRRALKRHDLKLVAEATYRRGSKFSQSYGAQVDILRAAGVDHVICVGSYAACAGFIRDARDAGWAVPIANVSFVGSESMLELLLEAGGASNRDYTRGLVNSQVVPSYYDLSLPSVAEYRKLIAQAPMPPADVLGDSAEDYMTLPQSFVSFEGFLDAKLLVEMLRRMHGEFQPVGIPAAMESIHDLDLGIGSPVNFGPNRHQGLDRVYFTTVEADRFVPMHDWRAFRP